MFLSSFALLNLKLTEAEVAAAVVICLNSLRQENASETFQ